MRDVAAPAEADAASSRRCRSWSRTHHARLSGGRFGPGGELVCEQKGSVAGPATLAPPRARGRVVRHVSAAGGGRVARSAVSVLRLGLGCLRSWVRERAAWEVAWWGGVRSSEGQAGDEPGPHHTGALERVTRGALAASRRLGCEAAFLPRPSADPAVSRARAPAPWCRSPERAVTCPGRRRGRGSEVASGTRRAEPAAVHDHAVRRLSLLLLAGSPGRSAPSCRPAGRRPPSLSPAPGSRKRPRAPSLLVSRGGLVSGPGLYFFPAGGFAAVSPDAV